MSSAIARTVLTFQHNAKLTSLSTTLLSITPFTSLSTINQQLFKTATDDDSVVVTKETIFHPQGGGQPSDVGSITSSTSGASFSVTAVRMSADPSSAGQVFHLGRLADLAHSFTPGESVTQAIDTDKRLLYSRLHTAGHVLGAAVRHLLEKSVPGFDELKASHFPDSAACEFAGLIDGKFKGPIQERVDDYVASAMPVEIDFWDEDDFRKNGLKRLIPGPEVKAGMAEGEKYRVVKIVGAEVYPCGGTHVDSTDECGRVEVGRIRRQKGTSRVGYSVS